MFQMYYQLAKDQQAERVREAEKARLALSIARRRPALVQRSVRRLFGLTPPALQTDPPVRCC